MGFDAQPHMSVVKHSLEMSKRGNWKPPRVVGQFDVDSR